MLISTKIPVINVPLPDDHAYHCVLFADLSSVMSVRGRLLQAGRAGKVASGSAMFLIAIATISGGDRQTKAWLLNHSPAQLTNDLFEFAWWTR
jgi:hypothetical protein